MKRIITLIIFLIFFNCFSQNNCPATFICSDYSNNPNNAGTQELNGSNQGCLSGENNSDWLQISIGSSGVLSFSISPSGNRDFDFAVWGPNSTCPPTTNPIRCSFASNQGSIGGLGNGAIDNSEGSGGDGWLTNLNVIVGETYIILIDRYNSGSGNKSYDLTFSSTSDLMCGLLPIELLYFKCDIIQNEGIKLLWETVTETNNKEFIIEKSIDAINFIDLIHIKPNNGILNHLYEFTDYFVESNKLTYYRLKQIDFNGFTKTFNIDVCEYTGSPYITEYYSILGQKINYKPFGAYIIKLIKNNNIKYIKTINLEN